MPDQFTFTSGLLLIVGLVLMFVLSIFVTLLTSYSGDMARRRRYGIPTETRGQYIKGNLLSMIGRNR